MREISVNGGKAYIVSKDNAVNVVWENGEYCFALKSTGSLDANTIIEIAESIIEN